MHTTKRLLATTFLLVLAPFLPAETPGNLFKMAAPGTVQFKWGLQLDASKADDPDQVNRFLKAMNLKVLGSTINLASGSGIALSSDGLILTNAHVVALSSEDRFKARLSLIKAFDEQLAQAQNMPPAQRTKAKFPNFNYRTLAKDLGTILIFSPIVLQVQVANRETRPVRVLAADEDRDLALVRSDFVGLTPLKLADSSKIEMGEDVVALGYPLGSTLEDMFSQVVTTMTKGSITAIRKANLALQHSANISHGNSGGPLINARGLVIGVNSAGINDANNLNLAIAANTVRQFLTDEGYESVAKDNAALSDPKLSEPAVAEQNADSKTGLVTLKGFPAGSAVTFSVEGSPWNLGKKAIGTDGTLVVHDIPFGVLHIDVDAPVWAKVYNLLYFESEKDKKVSIVGYPVGAMVRLDDKTNYTVNDKGVLELPFDDKPHAFTLLTTWDRGFQTQVDVSDSSNYQVSFTSGKLSATGLPAGVEILLNGTTVGKADASGNWSDPLAPAGVHTVELVSDVVVASPTKVDLYAGDSAQFTAVPCGTLALTPVQNWQDLTLHLTDKDGKDLGLTWPEGKQAFKAKLGEGVYHLKGRLPDDTEDTVSLDLTVTLGQVTSASLPTVDHSQAWKDEQARIAAEKARKLKEFLDQLWYGGMLAGDPLPLVVAGGVSVPPFTVRVGVSYWPTPSVMGGNLTLGYWLSEVAGLHVGVGLTAEALSVVTTWDYGGATPATLTANQQSYGAVLMARWQGFAVEAGPVWSVHQRNLISPPADALGLHVLAGWMANY